MSDSGASIATRSGVSIEQKGKSEMSEHADSVVEPLRPASGEKKRVPKVGAVIAVHPPRMYYAARFLERWAACPAALEQLSVTIVFSSKKDKQLFYEALKRLSPSVPQDTWTATTCTIPRDVMLRNFQFWAAWKKWYGIAHLLDLGEDAPEYGLMLDSELELYDSNACKPGGEWSRLFERIRAKEATMKFPASKIIAGAVSANFRGRVLDGKQYDTLLITENANFAMRGKSSGLKGCTTPGCEEVRRQIKECLFSWWTDLPWLNLTKAARMLEDVGRTKADKVGGFRKMANKIPFSRFEYISYQQWCCINEGFHFRDVTDITGHATWGCYLEDPKEGAQIHKLSPLWISTKALVRSETGVIPKMSKEEPPLLIFHLDHDAGRHNIFPAKNQWEKTLMDIIKEQGRSDFDRNSIQ